MSASISIPTSILPSQGAIPLPASWDRDMVVAWLAARAAGDYAKCVQMLTGAGWTVVGEQSSERKSAKRPR